MNLGRLTLAVLVLLLIVGGFFGVQQLRPRLLEVQPAPEAERIAASAPLRLTFSQPMQPDSVIERLRISPSVEGEFRWEADSLIFTPQGGWPPGGVVDVQLSAGARSRLGLSMLTEARWRYTVARPRLAYLWPAGSPADLYTLDLESGLSDRLTQDAGVLEFSVRPDGNGLVYSAANTAGGSDLWAYDLIEGLSRMILPCGEGLCRAPVISPDEGLIAFLRSEPAHAPEVWLFSPQENSAQVISPPGHETRLPAWSPEGVLSYYDATDRAYTFLNLEADQSQQWDNQTGEVGAWSAAGEVFAAPELFVEVTDTLRGPSGEAENQPVDAAELEPVQVLTSRMLAFDTNQARAEDLSGTGILEDNFPAFSPDGSWLTFARKFLDEERWTPGRQLWLMRPDGGSARSLTDAPDYKHTAFAWHPDSGQIAYVRSNQIRFTEPPEIWLFDLLNEEQLQLVIGGYAPQWLP